ncbi:MAG: hypothetical protein AAGJ18_20745 [Bacteroidota bacterium]
MKKFDNLDSLTHLNFPNPSTRIKWDRLGSLLLSTFAFVGLFAMNSPIFSYSNSTTTEQNKSTKFWLTPSSLNAEKTAFAPSTISNDKAGTILLATNDRSVATKSLN